MRHTSKRGKRAGKTQSFSAKRLHDVHSRIAGLPAAHHAGHAHAIHGSSSTAVAINAAKYYEGAFIEETEETHCIPRKSLTERQLLGVFPQELETVAIPSRQITFQRDRRTGATVEVSDPLVDHRLTWKSDKSLLRKGNPFADAESGRGKGYKRDGSVSVGLNTRKYRENVKNADPVMEIEIGPALDIDAEIFEPPKPITDAELTKALLGDKGCKP